MWICHVNRRNQSLRVRLDTNRTILEVDQDLEEHEVKMSDIVTTERNHTLPALDISFLQIYFCCHPPRFKLKLHIFRQQHFTLNRHRAISPGFYISFIFNSRRCCRPRSVQLREPFFAWLTMLAHWSASPREPRQTVVTCAAPSGSWLLNAVGEEAWRAGNF